MTSSARITCRSLMALGSACLWLFGCAARDPYLRLAKELAGPVDREAKRLHVAVLPFQHLERRDPVIGRLIGEKLLVQMSRHSRQEFVERTLLDRLMEEQKLGLSGTVTPESAVQLGRLLGADALVFGTVNDIDSRHAQVRGRIVEADSGRILASAQVLVPIEWESPSAMVLSPAETHGSPEPPMRKGPLGGRWRAAPPLPQELSHCAAAAWNGRIYLLGGFDRQQVEGVRYSEILPGGGMGPWQETTPLPEGILGSQAIAYEGNLYSLGGYSYAAGGNRREVYYSKVNADGTLGKWKMTKPLPFPAGVGHFGAVVANGYLYAVGGQGGPGSCSPKDDHAQVYFARLCGNGGGLCGPWEETSPLPAPRSYLNAASARGERHVYALGGYAHGCRTPSNAVFHAVADASTGRLGAWEQISSLPAAVAQNLVLSDGKRLYSIGGHNGAPSADVHVADISENGSPGPWRNDLTLHLPAPRAMVSGVLLGGRIYLMGGDGGGFNSKEVYHAGIE